MAYIDQTKKQEISAKLTPIMEKYGVKGRLSIKNHSTLVLSIKSGNIDFIADYNSINAHKERFEAVTNGNIDINRYHYENYHGESAVQFFKEVYEVMNEGNWDRSDVMTDYFDVGWYVDVKIGAWDKPYAYSPAPRSVDKVIVSDIKAMMKQYGIKVEELA